MPWGSAGYERLCTECRETWFYAVRPDAELCSNRCRVRRSRRVRGLVADPGGPRSGRICSECDDEFEARTYRTVVCSTKCKQRRIRRVKREARERERVTT